MHDPVIGDPVIRDPVIGDPVIPAQAGIQGAGVARGWRTTLGPRLRGDDVGGRGDDVEGRGDDVKSHSDYAHSRGDGGAMMRRVLAGLSLMLGLALAGAA